MEKLQENKVSNGAKISPRRVLAIVKKSLTALLLIACALLLVVTGWLAIDKLILKSQVPSFAGYSILVIATGSMQDTIMEGDLIIIKDTGEYKIGDIVTFAHEGEKTPTTHRIVDFADDSKEVFITRGDANNTQDRVNVTKDEIFGEVVLVMHDLGLLVGWLTKGGGFIYVLAVILIFIFGIYLIKDDDKQVQLEPVPEGADDGAAPVENNDNASAPSASEQNDKAPDDC